MVCVCFLLISFFTCIWKGGAGGGDALIKRGEEELVSAGLCFRVRTRGYGALDQTENVCRTTHYSGFKSLFDNKTGCDEFP